MYRLVFTIAAFSCLSMSSFACDIDGRTGFIPKNNLRIDVGDKAAGGLSLEQFNRVLSKIEKIYSPEFVSRQKKLLLNRFWESGEVNAYAHPDGNVANVDMYGGLARFPKMNEDGYSLVACHEIGHHLGGAPHAVGGDRAWAANEGQADYFGNLKCLRKVFADEDNQQIISKMVIPTIVTQKCSQVYKNQNEFALCVRTTLAGLVLGQVLNQLNKDTLINIATPEKTVVKKTFDDHPKSQCRLDTYFQASLCDKAVTDNVSDTDYKLGTCTISNGEKVGVRPACWFKEM